MTSVLEQPTEFNECLVCKLLDTRAEQINTANTGKLYTTDGYQLALTLLMDARRKHAKECKAQLEFLLFVEAVSGTGGGV